MTHSELDRLMHDNLEAIGPDLPEPTLSPEVRQAILSGEACAASCAPGARGLKITVGALGALAACLAIATAIVIFQNVQLRGELAIAQRDTTDANSVVLEADQPEYMLVNMFYEGCARAEAMRPQVEALRARHKDANIAFIDLNVTNGARRLPWRGVRSRRTARRAIRHGQARQPQDPRGPLLRGPRVRPRADRVHDRLTQGNSLNCGAGLRACTPKPAKRAAIDSPGRKPWVGAIEGSSPSGAANGKYCSRR
jgi:hypothetical protein